MSPEGAAARVFTDALEIFEMARRGQPDRPPRGIRLAGRPVCLRFAGDALEPALLPAFSHLPVVPVERPELTILCWDDASTAVRTPEPPGAAEGNALYFVDGPIRMAWDAGRRSLAAFDASRGLGLLRFADAREVVLSERSGPARRILHWWSQDLGLQMAHASAVGTAEGGVLLVGRGGSGKSTTASACLGSDLRYLADDLCLLSTEDGPRVHALYASAKVDTRSIARVPHLQHAFDASTLRFRDESTIFVTDHFEDAMIDSAPLRAILVPCIGAERCELIPISAGEALRAAAPSTMLILPGGRKRSLQRLAAVTRAVPCFTLSLPPSPMDVVPVLARLARGEGVVS